MYLASAKSKISVLILVTMMSGCHLLPQPNINRDQLRIVAGTDRHIVADKFTRQTIAPVHRERVKILRVYGGSFMRFANDPIETKNSDVIQQFLEALRHSVRLNSLKELGNRGDFLEIYLETAKPNTEDDPLTFRFLARTKEVERDCFGPKFKAALSALGQAEAKRYASLVRSLQGRVTAVSIDGEKKYSINKETDIRDFLTKLGSLDGQACAYGDMEETEMVSYNAILKITGSKQQEINLLVSKKTIGEGKIEKQPVWLRPFTEGGSKNQ